IWTREPPSAEIRMPATTTVTSPSPGLAPEAIAIAMASGSATIATVRPATRSAASSRPLYSLSVVMIFGWNTGTETVGSACICATFAAPRLKMRRNPWWISRPREVAVNDLDQQDAACTNRSAEQVDRPSGGGRQRLHDAVGKMLGVGGAFEGQALADIV